MIACNDWMSLYCEQEREVNHNRFIQNNNTNQIESGSFSRDCPTAEVDWCVLEEKRKTFI